MASTRTLDRMTEPKRYLTRPEAAALAGVSERTINRWAARKLLWTYRPNGPYAAAAYDAEEVLRVALRETTTLTLPEPVGEPETDIST